MFTNVGSCQRWEQVVSWFGRMNPLVFYASAIRFIYHSTMLQSCLLRLTGLYIAYDFFDLSLQPNVTALSQRPRTRLLHSMYYQNSSPTSSMPPPCRYWLLGRCDRRATCTYRHDLSASPLSHSDMRKTTKCRFFATAGGCRNGDACPWRHVAPVLPRIPSV